MAKVQLMMPDEFLERLAKLGDRSDEISERVLEAGGEVAQNLYRLYEYLHYQLVQANIKKDNALIDDVLTHLRDLKQTWEEAIRISTKENKALGGGDEEDDPLDERREDRRERGAGNAHLRQTAQPEDQERIERDVD